MQFAFDLISDLHVDQWQGLDWSQQATSPVCIVAGNVATGHKATLDVLRHLTQSYQVVFYIDGSVEHDHYRSHLFHSYQQLTQRLSSIPRLVYLQDNVVVLHGVAILATNGWWNFDFDPKQDPDDVKTWYNVKHGTSDVEIEQIGNMCEFDTSYMIKGVRRLQTHTDVKRIVMVTHSVPDPTLIDHDISVAGQPEFSCMGNSTMQQALIADTENKISTWCFGRYHGSVDQIRNGIRFVNNSRGSPSDPYPQTTYYPRRIIVEI
jgi:hypothetical protein